MRTRIILLMCFVTILSHAQDTTFYDRFSNKVDSKILASSYSIINRNVLDTNIAVIKTYLISGQIKSECNYSDYSKKKKQGKEMEWHKNGQLKSDVNYEGDQYDGNLTTYWENGVKKRMDTFAKGKMLTGICFDSTGSEIKHFDYSIMPVFPGGEEALFQYLGKEVKYPNEAKDNGISGKVYVDFVINKEGKVVDVKVRKAVEGLAIIEREALRVIQSMPNWSIGMLDGVPASVSFTMPINFKLASSKK